MRRNCCNAICFSRCPKELFLSRANFRKAVKSWASVSWLFMWNILFISCFTVPNYFVPAPITRLVLGCPLDLLLTSSVPACCSPMCLNVFLHSPMSSDVFFLGPMCSDVFLLGPMCPNWWRRLLTAHTASQSQSSHKPHSRRDSKPIFTQNPKSKSHFFWNQKCAPPIFSSFHQNSTKIALLIKSNKEFGEWTRLSLTK